MKNVLIIGAGSAIAQAFARIAAQQGDRLYLLARSEEKLQRLQDDLVVRGASTVHQSVLDVNALDQHVAILDEAFAALGHIDRVLIAHGTLPDQVACQQSVNLTLEEIQTNAISTIALLTELANRLEQQRGATIAVITSVAGDRGRQSNYVYGAAKAMVSVFLQGLRNRLHASGVNVLDIKPGFVDTPMTREFDKGLLWAQPESVAEDIQRAIEKRRHQLYTPFFWRYIMLVIRSIPEFIFRKMSL